MRILLVAPQPFYVERGTPIAVRHLAEALSAMGHDVDLLTAHLGEDVEIDRCTIHRARGVGFIKTLPIGFSLGKLAVDASLFLQMTRLIRRKDYDVIHAVEESVFLALPLLGKSGPSLVYDMDSVLSDQLIEKYPRISMIGSAMQAMERRAIRAADLVLPVCEAIAERARNWGAGDVHLLPDIAPEPAPETGLVPSIREDSTRPLALYVGNLDHYQGIDLLLDSLALLDQKIRPDTAIIGGSDQAIAHYRGRAEALGLSSDVRFLGPRPVSDLMPYLAQADLLLSPRTKGINTPMKVYAYMASGVPIVATDIISHSQVIDEYSSFLGLADPQGFSEALRSALTDPANASAVGSKAAQIARQQYGIARYRERLSDAYRPLEGAHRDRQNTSAPQVGTTSGFDETG